MTHEGGILCGPIRILHVLQRMEAGGSQTFLMNLYRSIDRSKVQFDFMVEYTQKQFYDEEIESLGGHVYRTSLHEDYNLPRFERFLTNFFANNHEYHIVHCHAYTIGFFVLRAAHKAGVPIRVAHSHNNSMTPELLLPLKVVMRRLFPIHATNLMAASTEAGKFLFGNRDFMVVKNAIDVESFRFDQTVREATRSELGYSKKDLVVGNVGRLERQKNQTFLLDIFAETARIQPDAKLLLVGDGALRNQLISKANFLGIDDRITFLSNRKDMYRLFQAMDVFVLPSLFEGLGIAAIEAQSAGLPTICSDGVAEDANVSPLFQRLPLDGCPDKWAKIIAESWDKRDSASGQNGVKAHGFDIYENSIQLQEWYLMKESSYK